MWVELAMVQNQKMLPNFFPMWVELPMVQNQKILPNFFLVYGTRTQLKEKKKKIYDYAQNESSLVELFK